MANAVVSVLIRGEHHLACRFTVGITLHVFITAFPATRAGALFFVGTHSSIHVTPGLVAKTASFKLESSAQVSEQWCVRPGCASPLLWVIVGDFVFPPWQVNILLIMYLLEMLCSVLGSALYKIYHQKFSEGSS